MKKTITIYILMIIIILCLILAMNIPWGNPGFSTFPRLLHISFETLMSILMLLIFLAGNNLYTKTKDERFAILAGGFLFGAILNLVHVITVPDFPYDTLSLDNLTKHRTLVSLLLSNIIISLSIYISLIYKPPVKHKEHFRFKVFSMYFYVIAALLGIPFLIYQFLPGFTNKLNIIISSLECIVYTFYIMLASILINLYLINKQKYFPTFLLGLIIFGLGGIFFINPAIRPISGILAHIFQIVGLFLMLSGAHSIQPFTSQFKFKDELVAYLSLLLVTFYVFFISITAGIFNIMLPPLSAYLFIVLILFFQLVIYIIASISWERVADIYTMAEREQSIVRTFESIQRISNPNIVKNTIINEIKTCLNPDKSFIVLYDKDSNSFSLDKYYEKLPSRTLFDSESSDEELLEFKEFQDTFKNFEINFANIEDYLAENSLKKSPQETLLKKYNIKSNYSLPINHNSILLGYLILQYTNEYKELSSEDLSYLARMANQIGITINHNKGLE